MKFKLRKFLEKKENVYLALALTLGLFMAIFNPPFAGVPDEHAHFLKAWSIASGNFVCSSTDAIPTTAKRLPDQIKPISYTGIKDKKIVVAKLKEKLFEKDTNSTAVIGGSICSVSPLSYAPQAIGLKLGKSLNFSALADFYLARLLNLFLAVFFTYLAIRIIPFGKIILLLIALLPMTIQQYASLSYDALHIALIFLFIAYVLRLAVGKNVKIEKKELLILAVIFLLAMNVKQGFFVLSLLFFLLPIAKFKSKKTYWLFSLGIISLNLLIFLGTRMMFTEIAQTTGGDIIPATQANFVLHNPLNFLMVVFETSYGRTAFFMETFLFKPGWLKISMPHLWYVFMLLGLVFFIRNEDEEVSLSNNQRYWMLFVFLGSFVLVFLSLYLFWTNVGDGEVKGVQGRYFLSFSPLLILAFYKSKFNFRFDFVRKHLNIIFIVFIFISFLLTFSTLYEIYYSKSAVAPSAYEQYANSSK